MRKTRLILIYLIVFIFSLSGCTKQYDYNFEELVNSAEEIYIVDIEREEYYGDISIDYLMKIENEFENFLTDLTSLKFEYSILLSPLNNTGINIMIVCNNEQYDYVIIGLRGIEEFKNNKQIYLHNAMCDKDTFNNILNKYYK